MGVLDAFWDEKGYMNAPTFRRFCNSTVPLARIEKFVFRNNETLEAKIQIAHFGKEALKNVRTLWRIRDTDGLTLKEGVLTEG